MVCLWWAQVLSMRLLDLFGQNHPKGFQLIQTHNIILSIKSSQISRYKPKKKKTSASHNQISSSKQASSTKQAAASKNPSSGSLRMKTNAPSIWQMWSPVKSLCTFGSGWRTMEALLRITLLYLRSCRLFWPTSAKTHTTRSSKN